MNPDTPQGHRPKLTPNSRAWVAYELDNELAVTTNLSRKDPRYHGKDARAALEVELRNLKDRGAWDFNDVVWREDAKRKYGDKVNSVTASL